MKITQIIKEETAAVKRLMKELVREDFNAVYGEEAKAKNPKLFYIGKRSNPQFKKPYYKAFGQLSSVEAKKKGDPSYGSMSLTSYNTKEEYDEKIKELRNDGFTVNESKAISGKILESEAQAKVFTPQKTTFSALKALSKNGQEGIVLYGTGGELQDWITGIMDHAKETTKTDPQKTWDKVYVVSATQGRTDMIFTFAKGADIGKFIMYKLQIDGSWLSDYVVNYADQHGEAPAEEEDYNGVEDDDDDAGYEEEYSERGLGESLKKTRPTRR